MTTKTNSRDLLRGHDGPIINGRTPKPMTIQKYVKDFGKMSLSRYRIVLGMFRSRNSLSDYSELNLLEGLEIEFEFFQKADPSKVSLARLSKVTAEYLDRVEDAREE